jgi:hypothetical protein
LDDQVAEILRGYARANEFIERERISRLRIMSVSESRAIFDELVKTGQRQRIDTDQSSLLFQWRLQSLTALRQTFAALARAKGLV